MNIEIPGAPIAGASFYVILQGYRSNGHIAIYIEGDLALEKDCDDPPCHEVIFLTRNLAGRTLRVLARGDGETKEMTFTIGMKEAEGGAMMAG